MDTHTHLSTVYIELIQHTTNEHPQAIDHSISTNSGHKQTICPRGNCIPGGDSESRVHPTIIDVFDCVVVMVNDVSAWHPFRLKRCELTGHRRQWWLLIMTATSATTKRNEMITSENNERLDAMTLAHLEKKIIKKPVLKKIRYFNISMTSSGNNRDALSLSSKTITVML